MKLLRTHKHILPILGASLFSIVFIFLAYLTSVSPAQALISDGDTCTYCVADIFSGNPSGYDCRDAPCFTGGGDGGTSCPNAETVTSACPAGQTGEDRVTTYYDGAPPNCQAHTSETNTCSAPACNNTTTDHGCTYGGNDYVTTDCHGTVVSESNTCQAAPTCNNTTTDQGCQYGGHDYVTTDCHGAFVSESYSCQAAPVCNNTTTNEGCAAGYTGSDNVTRDCHGTVVSESNSCTPVSCPAASTSNLGCPAGYTGTHTQTTTYSNPPTCTPSTADNNSCTQVSCPATSTTNVGCPAGYTGTHTQTTIYTWPSCSPSTTDQNSCTIVACPASSTATIGCPTGYTGTHTQTTTYSWPACSPSVADNNACTPGSSNISVSDNIASSWSISPGGQSGTGAGSASVTSGSGTLYTISPAFVSGYNYPPTVTNSVTGIGSSMVLFGGQDASFALSYTVSFDYGLTHGSMDPIKKGGIEQYGQMTITKTITSGSTQAVNLSLSGVPAGVDYTIANQTCSPNCTSTITFTVHPTATAGTYPITVTGSSPTHTTSFDLVLQDSPAIMVSCSGAPTPTLIGQEVTWTSSVSGGVPPYSYAWTGTNIPTSPAPSGTSFAITYSTLGVKSAQLNVTDSLSNRGTCSPAGNVKVNFNPKIQEF